MTKRSKLVRLTLVDNQGNPIRGRVPAVASMRALFGRAGIRGCFGVSFTRKVPMADAYNFHGGDVRIAENAKRPSSGIIGVVSGGNLYLYRMFVPEGYEFRSVHKRLLDAVRNPTDSYPRLSELDLPAARMSGPESVLPMGRPHAVCSVGGGEDDEDPRQLIRAIVDFIESRLARVHALAQLRKEISDDLVADENVLRTLSLPGHPREDPLKRDIVEELIRVRTEMLFRYQELLDTDDARFVLSMVPYPRRGPTTFDRLREALSGVA